MTLNKYNEVMENVKVTEDMKKRILENLEKAEKDESFASDKITSIESAKKKNVIVPFIRRYGAVAAMLAVALVGSYAFFTVHNSGNNMMSATSTADFAEAPAAMEEAMEYESVDAAPADAGKANGEKAVFEEVPAFTTGAAMGNEMVAESGLEESGASEYKSARRLSLALKMTIKDIESLLAKSPETHYRRYESGMAEISYLVDGETISFRMLPANKKLNYEGRISFGDYSGEVYTTTERALDDYTVILEGDGKTVDVALWNTEDAYYYLSSDRGRTEDEMMDLVKEIIDKDR